MSLDLALIGNGAIAALIDPAASITWACFPALDGDPAFTSLLQGGERDDEFGMFAVELVGAVRTEQMYLDNTPVLVTRLHDAEGGAVELTDFAPRFRDDGRTFCPMMLVRQIRRISGTPRIRITLRPARHYGCEKCPTTIGSTHIRYHGGQVVMRLTTDAPITAILDESPIYLEDHVTLLLGADETVDGSVAEVGRHLLDDTVSHWQEWVRMLAIPLEWQDAVIRAAITLQLNVFEETGAMIAAVTTSIPEAAGSGRNWDYRYCWIRDAYFVVNALGRLGETRTMQRYLTFVLDIAAGAEDGLLKPLYGIDGGPITDEVVAECLSGYREMGPVRIGNQAHRQVQHDVYGEVVLTAEPLFVNPRAKWIGDEALLARLEVFGEHAARLYDAPDAGLWELRGSASVHTFSSIMCWAACDRLATYAKRLGLDKRSEYWRAHAATIHEVISRRSWNSRMNAFTATMDGDTLDASLLLMPQLRFLRADDPRFVGTVAAIEHDLKHGDFVYRYIERDDFGAPENAFLVCTFWYIEALAALGRREEAVALFEKVLSARNSHGLLAEDLDPTTLEQWGNFPQTYCMAGIISCATALSR